MPGEHAFVCFIEGLINIKGILKKKKLQADYSKLLPVLLWIQVYKRDLKRWRI